MQAQKRETHACARKEGQTLTSRTRSSEGGQSDAGRKRGSPRSPSQGTPQRKEGREDGLRRSITFSGPVVPASKRGSFERCKPKVPTWGRPLSKTERDACSPLQREPVTVVKESSPAWREEKTTRVVGHAACGSPRNTTVSRALEESDPFEKKREIQGKESSGIPAEGSPSAIAQAGSFQGNCE